MADSPGIADPSTSANRDLGVGACHCARGAVARSPGHRYGALLREESAWRVKDSLRARSSRRHRDRQSLRHKSGMGSVSASGGTGKRASPPGLDRYLPGHSFASIGPRWSSLPLQPDVQPLRRGGCPKAWSARRELAGDQANRPLRSMDRDGDGRSTALGPSGRGVFPDGSPGRALRAAARCYDSPS